MGGGKKSGKKKAAKTVPLTVADALEWDNTCTDATTVVSDVIEEILWSGARMIVAHIVAKKSLDESARDAVQHAIETVGAMVMNHDYGEMLWGGELEAPKSAWKEPCDSSLQGRVAMQQNWTLEEEPGCITIDRFGTGMVRSKSRVNKLMLGELVEGEEEERCSTTSRSSASQKSSTGKRSVKKRKAKKEPEPERIPRALRKGALQKEATRMFELKKLDKKKKQRQRAKMQQEEILEEKKRYDKIQKDLKGKNYILDEFGKVVLVEVPRPERMPAMTLEPKVGLHDPQALEERIAAMERNKNGNKKGSKKGKKPTKPLELTALDRNMFVDLTTALGPPVISVFEAKTGVCFSQGMNTKRGPTRQGEGFTTLSRSQYNKHLETLHGKPVVMQNPSAPQDTATASQTKEGGFEEATVNITDGLPPPAALSSLEPVTLKRLSPKSAAAEPPEPDDAFNLSILNDPTWGTKHKMLDKEMVRTPHNPLSPQQRAALRAQMTREGLRGPRERPHADKVPSAQRKHLPAPIYPATVGHGFDTSDSYGVVLPDINQSSRRKNSSSPEPMRTSNRGEMNKIIFANESSKMQLL